MTNAPTPRWLTLVGIGEDGLDGLSPAARRAIAQAKLVVGGKRHLALVDGLGRERLAWPSPLTDAIPTILARRGHPVCVLASGDPFFYGVGATLMAHIPADEILCLPAPSAFSLAAARLGWALQDCALVSLHGRAFERVIPHLQPGAKLLILAWDGETPRRLAHHLAHHGMGRSRLVVCEAMGGPRERLVTATAAELSEGTFDPLNTIALEVVAGPGARILPLASGLPDHLFEHDGQLTKREIRAVTLAALAPRQGETLWDVGAGSGSIGIEWMLRHPANRAVAIEARADRAARIARNALALGVPDLAIIEGRAPDALAGLAAPDAVFVGGGASDTVLAAALAVLPPGGRLVVNAVTVETQALLARRFKERGGELVSMAVSRAEPLGQHNAWRPALPVVQWRITKAEAAGGPPLPSPAPAGEGGLGVSRGRMRALTRPSLTRGAPSPASGRGVQGPRLAVGVGCRAGTSGEVIARLVEMAIALAGQGVAIGLFTLDTKSSEPGLAEAALALRLPLVGLPHAALAEAAPHAATRSARVMALHGLPSIAETAALAGASAEGRLVVPRLSHSGVSCAVARLPDRGAAP